MNPANLKAARVLLAAVAIIFSASIAGNTLYALAGGPSKAVRHAVKVVKDESDEIAGIDAEIKPLKEKRAEHEGQLKTAYDLITSDGWTYDLTSGALAKIENPPVAATKPAPKAPDPKRRTVYINKEPVMTFSAPSWEWKGAPDYKNDRLAYYEQQLMNRGIIDREHLKLLVANLIIENGALDENANGDGGCSVGIPQRYVCQFGYTAKSFRKKYPEWNDWQFQLRWMADHTVASYEKYKGDVFRTIVSHNSPAAAARNVDSCHISPCYYRRVLNASNLLTSL